MKIQKSKLLIVPVIAISLLLAIHACKKPNDTIPHNPYDDIHRDDTTSYGIPLDSLTITYVHKKVLSTRCALPGCHDGHFEPDYRTPQSSFSTLVYASIIKNNTSGTFKYRVIPFDTTHSVLYERITNCCFVTHDDRMPQDNIGVPLPDSSINLIASWIMHGARDMFGNVAHIPNTEPTFLGYVALSTDYTKVYSGNRLDSVPYNPMVIPDSIATFYVGIQITDDSTPQSQLQFNRLKISTHEDDFSAASTYNAFFVSAGTNSVWITSVPASTLPMNDTLFMRYYVNDGSHSYNTEFPRTETPFYYKYFWSFIRKP